MHRNIETLDKYFKHCENREACYAYDCIRKDLVEGQKPTTLAKVFSIIYKKWLYDDFTGFCCKIVKIKNWKTLLVDDPCGNRKTISPCIGYFDNGGTVFKKIRQVGLDRFLKRIQDGAAEQ